jgi:ABC-type sugar transport system ATPase subunit
MATIELQDVTKSFARPSFGSGLGMNKGVMGQQADRAFAERAAAQVQTESANRYVADQGERIVALDHVNLTIPDGQTLAIVGPSGCGKSTLLRVICGLEDYAGRVLYDGEDMTNVPPKDRYIGMVFQNYALYPHFKGHGNLSFFFKVRKIDDAAAEERIRTTSEIMGIGFETLLERKPGALSGGQQQRIAIARALVRNPRLFLFDEPLSNLDAKLRTQTRIEIKRLLRRFQITAVYVTHDQVEALSLGDAIAVMRAGKVEQVGDYQTLRDNPASSFVAGFLGTPPMNLLSGVVDESALRLGDMRIPLPAPIQKQMQAGQAVILGVRPEAIQLAAASSAPVAHPPGPGVHLRGMVEMVEPDYAHQSQLIYVRAGEHAFAVNTELDAAISGAGVEVVFPHDQLYFFDAATERRIQ